MADGGFHDVVLVQTTLHITLFMLRHVSRHLTAFLNIVMLCPAAFNP